MSDCLTVPKSNQVIEPASKPSPPCRLADVDYVCALNPVLAGEFWQTARVSLLEPSACALLQKFWQTI